MGDNGGELGECVVVRCEHQDGLLQERRETLCSLEAHCDEVGPIASNEVEGMADVNGCTRSLGGIETPGPLVVARSPEVIVPVCMVTSVSKCVLKRAHSVSEMACVSKMACVSEKACKEEPPCVRGTACVRARYEREMAVGMRENATACPSVMVRWGSVMARGSACMELRCQTRDKGRVAAVAMLVTVPDSHSSAREVRFVLCTRPPRARLRK